MDFEEQSPRICWYNTNPITLGAIGLAIQCVYEGSFLWLVRATHPYLEGDYYMEDDCLPDPVPSLPDPVPMPISTGKKQHPMPTEDVGTPTNIDSSSYPVPPLTPPQMSEMAEPSPQKYSTARNTPHSPSPAIVTSSPTEPLVVNPLNSADTTKQISNPPPSDKAEDRKGVTNHVPASEESYPGLQNPSTPPLYTPLSDKFLSPLHEPYEVKTPREDPVFIVNLPLPHNDEHELSLLPPLDLDFPSLLGIKEKTSRRDRKRRLHEPDATFSHDLLKKSGYHSSTKKKKWIDMTTEEQDEELYGPQTDSVRFDPTGTGRHRSQRDRRSRHRGRTYHTVDTPSPERRDDSPPPPPSTPHPSHAYLQRSLIHFKFA
ncbi:hypothetical protein H0H87_001095 [Tephrocybe sp. NHM501043]|nr:hypothetical protein H0H87_001095 [Tephrocybe sp. NHM501043]